MAYGWSGDNITQSRDRNSASSPDQRYDTLVQFNGKTWELAVPDGIYLVHMVAGDPSYYDSNYMINAEGVAVSNPHTFVLDDAGWKRVNAPQAEFKRMADPYGLMNPGKLADWQAQDTRELA